MNWWMNEVSIKKGFFIVSNSKLIPRSSRSQNFPQMHINFTFLFIFMDLNFYLWSCTAFTNVFVALFFWHDSNLAVPVFLVLAKCRTYILDLVNCVMKMWHANYTSLYLCFRASTISITDIKYLSFYIDNLYSYISQIEKPHNS